MACRGNSLNNTKAIQTKTFQRPSDAYVSTVKISFQLKLPFRSKVGGQSTPPPLGQGVGKKHLGQARVNSKGCLLTLPGSHDTIGLSYLHW